MVFSLNELKVFDLTLEEARLLGGELITPQHLSLGLISEGEGVAGQLLKAREVDLEAVRKLVRAQFGKA